MNFKPITILLIAFTVILVFTGCQSVKPGPYKPYKGIDPITYSSRRDLKFETDGSIFFSPLEADFKNLKVVPDTQGRIYAYKQDSNPSYYIFKEGLIIDKIIDAGSKKLTPHIEAGFSRTVEIQSVLSGNIAQIKAFPFNYHYYLTVDDAVLCKDKMRLRSTVEDTKIWKNDKLVGDYINGRYAASKARGKTLFLRDTFSKAASECSYTMDMYGNMADITHISPSLVNDKVVSGPEKIVSKSGNKWNRN